MCHWVLQPSLRWPAPSLGICQQVLQLPPALALPGWYSSLTQPGLPLSLTGTDGCCYPAEPGSCLYQSVLRTGLAQPAPDLDLAYANGCCSLAQPSPYFWPDSACYLRQLSA